MYQDKRIAVVVPAYNEETLVKRSLCTMPDFVDTVIVVDDASRDDTAEVIRTVAGQDARIHLIVHEKNQGVGGAICTGYAAAREQGFDVTAVMAADGQMDPDNLEDVIAPVVAGEVDYAKGNRLFSGDAWNMIPRHRYLGNSLLSLMTKIASGYWHVADSQSGYTAASLEVLQKLDLDAVYKRYGMPNDILIRLNENGFRVRDVPIRPVYNIGEKSGIRLWRVIPAISWLLFVGFWRRMIYRYVIRDFHPLVFFYLFGLFFGGTTMVLFGRIFYYWIWLSGTIPRINALAAMFSFMSASLFTLFAMWFDMETNKELR